MVRSSTGATDAPHGVETMSNASTTTIGATTYYHPRMVEAFDRYDISERCRAVAMDCFLAGVISDRQIADLVRSHSLDRFTPDHSRGVAIRLIERVCDYADRLFEEDRFVSDETLDAIIAAGGTEAMDKIGCFRSETYRMRTLKSKLQPLGEELEKEQSASISEDIDAMWNHGTGPLAREGSGGCAELLEGDHR